MNSPTVRHAPSMPTANGSAALVGRRAGAFPIKEQR
jgi:hypothetical protein